MSLAMRSRVGVSVGAIVLLVSTGVSAAVVSVDRGAAAYEPAERLSVPTVPTHPHSGHGPHIDQTAIPGRGSAGRSSIDIETAGISVGGDGTGVGAFRTNCGYSHMAFDDPIVHPGQPGAAHLHTFFGNTAVDAFTTPDSLRNTGNSTCSGGIANRSAYWIPSMIDTTTARPLVPSDSIWYYKTGYSVPADSTMVTPPPGFRMIAGNAAQTTPTEEGGHRAYRWHCAAPTGHDNYGGFIPDCPVGSSVALEVFFPQCWDGINLHTADQSHVVHADGSCPSTHPNVLPQITLNISWMVEAGQSSTTWRIASDSYGPELPGGLSAHADWFNGWDGDIIERWMDLCVRARLDCRANLLGDGTYLF